MLERAYKIAPFRTGVRMLGEIEAQALPEMIFPEDKGELVENPGSFGINDRAVGGFRVFEIGDVLIDGCCALGRRSEEHTSELQSRGHLVCRLLLEKKKKYKKK